MRIGLLKEGKVPPDSRVPLTPEQCKRLMEEYDQLTIVAAPYAERAYTDEEYIAAGVSIQEDLSDCDVLMGIKEVKINELIEDKTYLFFSHTIKEQEYNRDLLRAILKKNIRMVDYETLTNPQGARILGFGKFAGIVGAHNGLLAWGNRTGDLELQPARNFHDYAALKQYYDHLAIPPLRIVLTGGGRVAQGAMELLHHAGVRKVSPQEYLESTFDRAVYTQLDIADFYARDDEQPFDAKAFFADPTGHHSIFDPYLNNTELLIHAIYWDPAAPQFFTAEQMKAEDFSIRTIADVTCDIEGSIPSTLRASTIPDPVYGFDPHTREEVAAYTPAGIDMMAVDNLPNELPRDASEVFGADLAAAVIPELLLNHSEMIENATIAKDGTLTERFAYLKGFVEG